MLHTSGSARMSLDRSFTQLLLTSLLLTALLSQCVSLRVIAAPLLAISPVSGHMWL